MKDKQHDIVTDSIHMILQIHAADLDLTIPQIIQHAVVMSGWDGDLASCPNDVFYDGLENLLDDCKQDEK